MSARRIRILIVDDSALVRRLLTQQLASVPDFEVVGCATDPYAARDRILELQPDVITLDIEMPRMDGLEFLERVMRYHPLPVVIVSSLAPEGSDAAFRALELGAIEIVAKPRNQYSAPDVRDGLIRAIRAAGQAKVAPRARPAAGARPVVRGVSALKTTDRVVAIGASTGGTVALERVILGLPAAIPGIVIVQHMPLGMTAPFSRRLQSLTKLTVREARDGDVIAPGLVLVAPAGHHAVVHRSGAQLVVRLKDGPRVHHQRPAVDILFKSVAAAAGQNAIGVLLTGMGADGAEGLLAMKDAGAETIGESEESCVVYGMPRAAAELGAVKRVVALDEVANTIVRACA
ncbi:MAG: chemotaxis response regulator protein-glutamate methylesterase [Labilithrix sp.]